MHPRLLGSLLIVVAAAGCGDDSSPSAPTATTSSISVTVASPLKIGATTQASATAALSNGQSQSLTTGFQSDTPSVATVTAAGAVTGVGNGRATIFVLSGGRQGQQVIRVVPDYQGQWSGRLRVTTCSNTGIFVQAEFCDAFPVGSSDPFVLTVTQTGESVSGAPSYPPLVFSNFSAPIAAEGTVAFSSTHSSVDSPVGITANWRINSTGAGNLTGTVEEVWRLSGFPDAGEGRLMQEIISVARSATSSLTSASASSKRGTLSRLRGR